MRMHSCCIRVSANTLTLDRPFAYVGVSKDEIPLMIGVVENAMQMEE